VYAVFLFIEIFTGIKAIFTFFIDVSLILNCGRGFSGIFSPPFTESSFIYKNKLRIQENTAANTYLEQLFLLTFII